MGSPAHSPPDESSLLECLDVLRGGGERDIKRLGELAYGVLLPGEPAEHRASCGITQRTKHAVEMKRLHNHMVEYIAGAILVNRLVE